MKVVYVLVSDEKDYYWEECYLSICSLRQHNKHIDVEILVDDITENNLKTEYRKKIYSIADITVISFEGSIKKKERSRLLKTGIREYVPGTFLYIDSDTMICDDISDVFELDSDIAMVLDHHEYISQNLACRFYKINSVLTGFPEGYEDKHYNSGVIYTRDTGKAHEFFALWKKLYNESVKKGVSTDQASLNGANNYCNGIIDELSGIWNVQLDCGLSYINNAKILHYFNHNNNAKWDGYREGIPYELYDIDIIHRMKKDQCLSEELARLVKCPQSGIQNARFVPVKSLSYELMSSYHYKLMKICYVKFRGLFNLIENMLNEIYILYKRIKKHI